MKYADHINKELESDQASHSLLLRQMEENHRDYKKALNLNNEKIYALDRKYEEKSFLPLVVNGVMIEMTVKYVPVNITTRPESSSDWQLLVTAKCPSSSGLSKVGIGKAKKYSHLYPEWHEKVLQELERDIDGISIELQTPPTCFQAAFPAENPAQLQFNF